MTELDPFRYVRQVGDCCTWKILCDNTGVKPNTVPDSVIDYSQFRVAAAQEQMPYYYIKVANFRNVMLRFTQKFQNRLWCHFLDTRLERLRDLKIMEMDVDARP
jgi:hypothetical protein